MISNPSPVTLRSWSLGQYLNDCISASSFVDRETDTYVGISYSLLNSPAASFLYAFLTKRQHLRVI